MHRNSLKVIARHEPPGMSGTRRCKLAGRDIIDVIVTSSARNTIFQTIDSFLENVRFSGAYRFHVNVDCRHSLKVVKIEQLFKKLPTKYCKVNNPPIGISRPGSTLLRHVETKYYFHLEDDWIFLRGIELDPLIHLFNTNAAMNHIRFSKETILPYDELYYLRKLKFIPVGYDGFRTRNVVIDRVGLVETMNYSANPNISRSDHFKKMLHVLSLDIEQQFSLRSFLKKTILRRASGYYIYGQIGDAAAVKHIG